MMALPVAHADSDWVTVRSPHFTVHAAGSAADAKALVRQMERFRFYLGRLFSDWDAGELTPLTVIMVEDGASFEAITGIGYSKGFYRTSLEGPFAVVNDEPARSRYFRSGAHVLRHEYVHHLLHHHATPLYPLWFEEGLAEYLATFKVLDGKAVFGGLNRPSWALLRREEAARSVTVYNEAMPRPFAHWAPLDELMQAEERRLGDYSFERARSLFYAQSWAVVHRLMRDGLHSQRLHRLLELLQQDVSPQQAVREALDRSLSQLAGDAQAIFRRGYEQNHRIVADGAYPGTELEVEPLTAEHARSLRDFVASVVMATDSPHFEALGERLAARVEVDPASGQAATNLARYYRRMGSWEAAHAVLDTAAQHHGDHWRLARARAQIRFECQRQRAAEAGDAAMDVDALEQARSTFERLIDAGHGDMADYFMAAYTSAFVPPNSLQRVAPLAREAFRRNPVDPEVRLLYGQVLAAQDRADAACPLLRSVAHRAADTQSKALVRSVVETMPGGLERCPL